MPVRGHYRKFTPRVRREIRIVVLIWLKSEHGISWTQGKGNHFQGLQATSAGTIRVYHQQPNVRLVGFNAPETRRAECEAEAELGAKATRRLRDLVRAGNLDFTYVKCSCPEATQGDLRM